MGQYFWVLQENGLNGDGRVDGEEGRWERGEDRGKREGITGWYVKEIKNKNDLS